MKRKMNVKLVDYVRLARAYHQAVGHMLDFPDCEEGFCDEAHAVAFISEEGAADAQETVRSNTN